jgi:hypothetical protein
LKFVEGIRQTPDSRSAKSVWPRIRQHKVVEWMLAYRAFGCASLHLVEMLRNAFHQVRKRVLPEARCTGLQCNPNSAGACPPEAEGGVDVQPCRVVLGHRQRVARWF